MTGGGRDRAHNRRTLVACSGGCDSSALALILRSATREMALGHVVHDLRSEAEAFHDRDRVAELAQHLGVPFVWRRVSVRDVRGNDEANARRARYAALTAMAREGSWAFLATAHHADDQLETVLMRLIRGAGPAGLGGIAQTRDLGGVRLIRPMLEIDRSECEAICRSCGWQWVEDRTNRDESRLRNALRARVLPELRAIRPGVAHACTRSADLCAQAGAIVRERAAQVLKRAHMDDHGGSTALDRGVLRREPAIVLGEVIRLTVGDSGRDRLSQRVIDRVVLAIREQRGDRRVFTIGPAEIVVEADMVVLGRTDREEPPGETP